MLLIYGGYTSRTTTENLKVGVDSAWTLIQTNSNPPSGGYGIILATLKNEVYAFGLLLLLFYFVRRASLTNFLGI